MSLPWRTGAGPRPAGLPLPPARMPLWRDGRPLKRWRYVGFFGPEVMGCVASARIGPLRTSWWAVWDRASRTLVESTHRGTGGVVVEDARVYVSEGPVSLEIGFDGGPGVETVSPHGDSYIWTRKQAPAMRGHVTVADRRHEFDGRGIVDDSAGYHARHTAWLWSAGVGTLADGRDVAWNLVDGVHDAPENSERTVWADGEPTEVGRGRFVPGLGGVDFGSDALAFTPEATREHSESLLLFASEYEQPFGTFTGSLPGAGELREGYGVMERHDVKW